MRLVHAFLDALASLRLSCTLLVFLALLTWLGTLEQVNTGLFEVQKKYFESFFVIHHAGPLAIPLPGATLVMSVLFVNLVMGGLVRIRKGA
ncbi:MAG TPA: ResB protein required for cytochrome C biosynthesis, partial [Planctomycetota bacterium]|nr:ResB protein required for cytochrome C biosynthesis [Planctomycetota bacterium]